jgi:hypothetical protein
MVAETHQHGAEHDGPSGCRLVRGDRSGHRPCHLHDAVEARSVPNCAQGSQPTLLSFLKQLCNEQ